MGMEVREFFELIKRRDAKGARDWLEAFRGTVAQGDEFGRGYLLALQGMALALNGSDESLLRRVLEGKQNVESLLKDVNSRLSLNFRPKDEQGFDRAWVDFLHYLAP